MKQYWQQFDNYFSARETREKMLLAATLLALIYAVFHFAFFNGIVEQRDLLLQRVDSASAELNALSAQEKVLAKAMADDPNAVKRIELARLEKQLSASDEKLNALSVGLIPADQLPRALHDVLTATGKLRLLGMETLAPSELQLHSGAEDNSRAEDDGELEQRVGVFKHSVVVTFEGSYFEVIAYLQALEALPWKFYWQALDYRVERYPQARVSIEVYTLSTERGVLGV